MQSIYSPYSEIATYSIGKEIRLLIFIIHQNINGFSKTAIEKCIASVMDLFDLTKSINTLRNVYNNSLLTNIEVFRKQHLHIVSKFPIRRF